MTETTAAQPRDLASKYHDFMAAIIDESGAGMTHAMIINATGQTTMIALDVGPTEVYRVVLSEIFAGANEAIFALDRYTKAGQGTRYSDVLAGHYFAGPLPGMFRPFVIEYRPAPRAVEPICWDNPFWNGVLRAELMGSMYELLSRVRSHGL